MYTLSTSIFLSSLVLATAILASTWYEQKNVKKEEQEIFKITASGNLVRYNKKSLKMTLCGLSNQRYRCLEFDK